MASTASRPSIRTKDQSHHYYPIAVLGHRSPHYFPGDGATDTLSGSHSVWHVQPHLSLLYCSRPAQWQWYGPADHPPVEPRGTYSMEQDTQLRRRQPATVYYTGRGCGCPAGNVVANTCRPANLILVRECIAAFQLLV